MSGWTGTWLILWFFVCMWGFRLLVLIALGKGLEGFKNRLGGGQRADEDSEEDDSPV